MLSQNLKKVYQFVLHCPKILAQSFITVVNLVSQLCLFLNACCPREVNIHPDEPWYSSTLWVTCKVHKSVRWDNNYMREPCHPFYKGNIYLQETSLWRFHMCQETVGRDGQKLGPVQLQGPLGWSSLGPKALRRDQTFKKFGYTLLKQRHPWKWPINWEMGPHYDHLLNTSVNWPLKSSACSIYEAVIPVPPLLKGGIPWLSFVWLYVPIEVSRICLNVADQDIYIQIMLLPNIILNFSSQSFKFWFWVSYYPSVLFSMSFVSSANLFLFPR